MRYCWDHGVTGGGFSDVFRDFSFYDLCQGAHENVLVLEMLRRREHKVPACKLFGRFVSGLAGWDLGSSFRPGCGATPESAALLFFQDFIVCSMDGFAKPLGCLGSVWQRMKTSTHKLKHCQQTRLQDTTSDAMGHFLRR